MKCDDRKICIIYKVIQLKKKETPIENTTKADQKRGFRCSVFNMCLSLKNFCNTCRGLYDKILFAVISYSLEDKKNIFWKVEI